GTLKGKYGYMSPEQVIGQPIDGRSDLFAVGVVLAEMLMGRRLFTAPNDLDVLLMVRDARTDRLDRYCRDLPPALDRIVRRALRKDLRERYETAAAVHDDLADYLYATGLRVGPPDLRSFVANLFDSSPEAAAALLQQAQRMAQPATMHKKVAQPLHAEEHEREPAKQAVAVAAAAAGGGAGLSDGTPTHPL